jgi:chemotaxis protein MotB
LSVVQRYDCIDYKGAQNVEKHRIYKRKDLKITRMQDALTKRQCYTCFGYQSKRTVGFNDPDIEINVEKELYLFLLLINYYSRAVVIYVTDKAKEF